MLAIVSAAAATGLLAMFLFNLPFFRTAPRLGQPVGSPPRVSVLIPARNEATRIEALLESVVASRDVECEVLVLDDESEDGTAEIVNQFAARHPAVRLVPGQPKPDGWSGKQFACFQLGELAACDELFFFDADVTLSPDALSRTVALRRARGVELLSGFPRQRTESLGEALLIPLIPVVLLCFLPFVLMKRTRMRAAAAGCGQFFLSTRQAYLDSGGHSMIRESLHDGVTLPRAYRSQGYRTDCFDASDIASCRMYSGFRESWFGLLKNAHEGFARMPLLLVITMVMSIALIQPPVMLLLNRLARIGDSEQTVWWIVGTVAGFLPRFICCLRYDRAWWGCFLHPISVTVFLAIQWTSWWKRFRGQTVAWRERSYEVAAR